METKYLQERFIEELIAFIVISGGTTFNADILKNMTLEQILGLVYPNGIRFEIKSTEIQKFYAAQ